MIDDDDQALMANSSSTYRKLRLIRLQSQRIGQFELFDHVCEAKQRTENSHIA